MKALVHLIIAILALGLAPRASAQQGETRIRVGDKLGLSLSGVPPQESTIMGNIPFTVSNTGTIALPQLAEIGAVGLTPTELARRIETAYKQAEIYTRPRINVSRVLDQTTTQMVSVIGEVKTGGGTVIYRPGLTILDAIGEKGGFTDFADVKRVKLIRGSKNTSHNLKDVSKSPGENVQLQPEDRIIVPQSGVFGF